MVLAILLFQDAANSCSDAGNHGGITVGIRNFFGRVHLPVLIALLVVGCGSLTIDIDTKVKSAQQASHSLTIVGTGEIFRAFESELNLPELREQGWSVKRTRTGDQVTINMTIENAAVGEFDHGGVNPWFGDGGPRGGRTSVRIAVTDMGNYEEYRVSLDFGLSDELPTDELSQAMMLGLADMLLINWTVEVPGKIVKSNADDFTGSHASFNLNLVDIYKTSELYVVSRVDKKRGLSGTCNAPR